MNIIQRSLYLVLIVIITTFLSAGNAAAIEISITDNGSGSTSEATVTQTTETHVEQSNQATVENNVESNANSGNNEANNNTGGQTTVQSGAVENNVTIENSINNSTVTQDCCPTASPTPSSVVISGNGSNSQNSTSVQLNSSTTVTVNNNAVITNNTHGTANSGGNKANNNNGDVTITTGNVSVSEQVINAGINNANVSFSSHTNNDLLIKIVGNGAGSINTVNKDIRNNTTVAINQTADILNISTWFANSGNNTASGNLGNVLIATGDVSVSSVIKNIVNTSTVDISCCKEQTPPPPCTHNCGGQNPENPSNPNNPSNGGSGSSSGGSSGGGGSSAGSSSGGSVLGITSGEVLPATGGFWTMWLTILAGLLFALGFYLRMHPGRAPTTRFAI